MINVFVVDDHKVLIDTFIEYFRKSSSINIIGSALSGGEAIELLNPKENSLDIQVVLLDIGLPDIDGIECAKVLLKNDPKIKIIALSSYMQVSIVKKMLKAGAKSYLSKATDLKQLEEAINEVNNGELFLGEHIKKALVEEAFLQSKPQGDYLIPKLTSREKEVLGLISEENNTKEIAQKLFLSVNTIETHRKNLISKFNVKNSVGLVRKAIELKILKI